MSKKDGITIRRVSFKDFSAIKRISKNFIENSSDPDFLYDDSSIKQLFNSLLNGASYFKCLVKDNEVEAWMSAREVSPFPHSNTRVLSQSFYHSIRPSVLYLKKMHADLYSYASSHRYEIVLSSSILNNKETFYKILEKQGWRTSSVGALRLTPAHPNFRESQPVCNETEGGMVTPMQESFASQRAREMGRSEVEDQYALPVDLLRLLN